MVNRVVHLVRDDSEKTKTDKDLALLIKKDFDLNFYPTWHCIVGKISLI